MAEDITRVVKDSQPTEPDTVHDPIPGARDDSTFSPRAPGTFGRFGQDAESPQAAGWLDGQTAREHAREGGGNDGGGKPLPDQER